VRFVQLFDWGWDFHGTGPREDIRDGLTQKMARTDRPVAALIEDLRQRGCSTTRSCVWGGEFGRTPFREGRTASDILGRDHFPDCSPCSSPAVASAAASATARPTSSDSGWWRTRSTSTTSRRPSCTSSASITPGCPIRFQGRDYRLTDVHGEVVKNILV
jgi:hypothetical protein